MPTAYDALTVAAATERQLAVELPGARLSRNGIRFDQGDATVGLEHVEMHVTVSHADAHVLAAALAILVYQPPTGPHPRTPVRPFLVGVGDGIDHPPEFGGDRAYCDSYARGVTVGQRIAAVLP